jgi:hypothetical protein
LFVGRKTNCANHGHEDRHQDLHRHFHHHNFGYGLTVRQQNFFD